MKQKSSHHDVDRRTFLRTAATLAATGLANERLVAAFPQATSKSHESRRVAAVELDLNAIRKWDDSNGDTWDPFWADDDYLYSFNDDGRGFGKVQENLAFNRFDGDSIATMSGVGINPMAEYGPAGERGKDDHATWKACGQECIDGVFYAFVSRNVYGDESHDPLMRQTAFNSSLIKSTDRGKTWQRTAKENYERPMWPGSMFGAPFFTHYGKNGGRVDRDGSLEYVYATSTNGFWNDGDSLILARVARNALPKLDPADWEYFIGGDGASSDRWSKQIDAAETILERSAKCGETPICYVPFLGIYLLISWYNPEVLTKWFEPAGMNYDFYQAEHPWGPWSFIQSFNDGFLASGSHMYGPTLGPRFQEAHGSQVRLTMFTSGCQFEDKPSGIYKAWTIPVVLRTEPLPAFDSKTTASPDVKFSGEWTPIATPQAAEDKIRVTKHQGDSVTLSFAGTGIEYLAQKAEDYGEAELYLDGKLESTIQLGIKNFPVITGITVFQQLGLAQSRHTLKIVSADARPVTVQAFKIYR